MPVKRSTPAAAYLPLFALAPVSDTRHAWAALLLRAPADADGGLDALARVFGELGLGEALGGLAAIVSVDEPRRLDAELLADLPADKIVLLLPLACCTDPAQATTLLQLEQRGFRLMADAAPGKGASLAPSVSAVACAAAAPAAPPGRTPGPHLACGVDNLERLDQCRKAGYHWFAGDYPLHPSENKKQRGGSSRTLLLRLLAMVTSDADSQDIEALLKQDSSLSYHLLKLVNSVSFALTTTITSFSYAITILGRRQLQRWLQLLLYAQHRQGNETSPLLARAARRASMMEALCEAAGGSREDQEHAFMTGMFSLLEALFSMPLEKIVTPLHLASDIEEALLSHGGWLGRMLSLVEQSETMPASSLAGELESLLLTPAHYLRTQIQACAWAIQVSRDL